MPRARSIRATKGGRLSKGATHARTPFERMLRIHGELQSGKWPNCSSLAKLFEVSSKSIQRDLDFMRDRMGLPIDFSSAHNGYGYTAEVGSFPSIQISEGELFAMVVAEKALQQYRGTPFEKPLITAFKKMASSLPDAISVNLSDWDETISFRTTVEPLLNPAILETFTSAIAQHRQLSLEYRKPGSKQAEQRIVDPYHLANVNGEWFLFAYCHLRKDIRTFVPARTVNAQRTGKKFKRPAQFSLKRQLKNSFGIHSGKHEHSVVARFEAAVADYIREKRWHPSQKIVELDDGSLELHLNLSSLPEVQRWLMGWAGQVTAVSPPELVDALRQAAQQVLQKHPSVIP